VSAFVF